MMLRKTFREALKEDELQEVFDEIWPTWANEQAAMIFIKSCLHWTYWFSQPRWTIEKKNIKLKNALDFNFKPEKSSN